MLGGTLSEESSDCDVNISGGEVGRAKKQFYEAGRLRIRDGALQVVVCYLLLTKMRKTP